MNMKDFSIILFLSILLTVAIFSSEIDFTKINDWTAADTVNQYDVSNLWEYINGAADLFVVYGFQNLQSCEMALDDIEVVVDVYNMGNKLNAFGMYKTEKGDIQERLNIGTEAVITSPNQCLMLKNIYYIKLNVYEGQLSEEKAKNLLNSIAEILPGTNNFPQEFELLPSENKTENSEHFSKESYLGLSELKNCLYADYNLNGKDFQYFVIIPEWDQTHESIWKTFLEKWKKLDNNDSLILFRKIPYKGLVGILKTAKGIVGVTNSVTELELIKNLERITQE
jgi:hypothetical protein